jgi:conjugal transfer pilus assembly protein TraV
MKQNITTSNIAINLARAVGIISMTVGILSLSGCANVSGLDAKSNFSCKAPDGVSCQAISGVYANNPVSGAANSTAASGAHSAATPMPNIPVYGQQAVRLTERTTGSAIRSEPKIRRMWVAPWMDGDEDLWDQSYVYLTVDRGRWLIEHNRSKIRQQFAPIRPVNVTNAGVTNAGVGGNPVPNQRPVMGNAMGNATGNATGNAANTTNAANILPPQLLKMMEAQGLSGNAINDALSGNLGSGGVASEGMPQ